MPNRTYTFKNMMVHLVVPNERLDAVTDKLKLCAFHSTICLGLTQCPAHTLCNAISHGCGFRTFACPGGSLVCPGGSLVTDGPFGGGTPALAGRCGAGTGCINTDDCGGTGHPFDPRVNPAFYATQLAELKADLRAALADVEAQEQVLGDVLKPGSLEEADQLESELKGALKDVDAMKTKLRGKT